MRLTALLLMLSLAGCGSSPKTQFYTLNFVDGVRIAAGGPPIQLGHVDLPGALDRQSIVTHATGNRVNIADQDRWVAPLDELVQHALAADMRARLPHSMVLAAGDPTLAGARTLTLNVQQFMPDASGKVVLDVDWNLQHAGKSSAPRHLSIQTPMHGQGGEAIAEAMSRALGLLADDIVRQI
jgi:hypothetical protein